MHQRPPAHQHTSAPAHQRTSAPDAPAAHTRTRDNHRTHTHTHTQAATRNVFLVLFNTGGNGWIDAEESAAGLIGVMESGVALNGRFLTYNGEEIPW